MRASSLYVDSDNALGSPSGDVDDAFAIAALVLGGAKIAALSSVFGNTTALRARRNHQALARVLGLEAPILSGAPGQGDGPNEAARFLAASRGALRVVGLGPLTNVAAALSLDPALPARLEELIFVGTNASSAGRWPPWFPFDFNLTADRAASVVVLRSDIPLTLLPLDVAKSLRVRWSEVVALPGDAGRLLRAGARRWWIRGLLLTGARELPVWDLAAAMYVLRPELFEVEEARIRVHESGWVEYGAGEKTARVIMGFDADLVWQAFAGLCGSVS